MRPFYLRGLSLAAAPTFAFMALLTGVLENRGAMICGAHASSLSGMVLMYALMSAFHAGPWLKFLPTHHYTGETSHG